MSTITIIGTGLMCNALGYGWTEAGHSIRVGTRTPDGDHALRFTASFVGGYAEALDGSDAVVLAIPFPAVKGFIEAHRQHLDGKLIIDISNPFDHLAGNERAAAEFTAEALGTTDMLVAAFKDNFAATINDPTAADGKPAQVKVAADDPAAKAALEPLIRDLGLRALDCGPLGNARYIDAMVSLMLILDRSHAGFTMHTGWAFTGLETTR
ncbi:NAD(P)-binding domain-containing protein [uncultured Leifsonia sp.]|uniref:NADPH-dependent F420 reductase n=1 Tax=uncultured Leifsonia sp. TaxID=340359 RepID=UPI0028D09C23|nr:NAD(P)-binding domain-containing protein [uncultured Leifsonia sp.]